MRPAHLHIVRPPPPPKPKATLVRIIVPLTEETRLVRVVARGDDGTFSGCWRLERLERAQVPRVGPMIEPNWRPVGDHYAIPCGQLPQGVTVPHRIFIDQLRQAADELDAANIVEKRSSTTTNEKG